MEILVKETMVSTKALRHEGLFLLSIYLSIFVHVPVFFHSFSMLIPTRRSIYRLDSIYPTRLTNIDSFIFGKYEHLGVMPDQVMPLSTGSKSTLNR